jgi:hypothetical protein
MKYIIPWTLPDLVKALLSSHELQDGTTVVVAIAIGMNGNIKLRSFG